MTGDATIDRRWAAQLDRGLAALGIRLQPEQCAAALHYLALLARWNRAFNLTAVRDPMQMVSRHLLDSLSILPWVDRGPVLDVGTGAGLPGIPLAIARPQLDFDLLDTNAKKTRFVLQAAGELHLGNVSVIRARVETLERPGHYQRITARAFASLADLVAATRPLLAADGAWLAMKGPAAQAEIDALPDGVVAERIALAVPGAAAARQLVRIRPA